MIQMPMHVQTKLDISQQIAVMEVMIITVMELPKRIIPRILSAQLPLQPVLQAHHQELSISPTTQLAVLMELLDCATDGQRPHAVEQAQQMEHLTLRANHVLHT